MRREELYLADMIEASEAISKFLAGRDEDEFASDDLLRSAVLHKLTIIGEAAARLPAEFRARHPEIPWAQIVGFRNVVVHTYFAVNWTTVWLTATERVPELHEHVTNILRTEFPDST